ncbi:MAG: hypothetical protein AAFQ22_07130 [Pseudomonadota bacterium]
MSFDRANAVRIEDTTEAWDGEKYGTPIYVLPSNFFLSAYATTGWVDNVGPTEPANATLGYTWIDTSAGGGADGIIKVKTANGFESDVAPWVPQLTNLSNRVQALDSADFVTSSELSAATTGFATVASVYTKTQVDDAISAAVDAITFADIGGAGTTLSAYGITDTYTKTEADGRYLASTDYNANDVLTKLKTVDGPASGISAQFLGGQAESYFRDLGNATGTLAASRVADRTLPRAKLLDPIIEPTLATLRARTDLTDGTGVSVLGRVQPGDWGPPRSGVYKTGNYATRVTNDEVTTNEGDGGYVVALNSDKSGATGAFLFDKEGPCDVRYYGANGDTASTVRDHAAIDAIERSSEISGAVSYGGLKVRTSKNIQSITKTYFGEPGGSLLGTNNFSTQTTAIATADIDDLVLRRPRSKTPSLEWEGKRIIWFGTSIPHDGAAKDSYPFWACDKTGAILTFMPWSGSHATFDYQADPNNGSTSKALAMTEAHRLSMLATHGASSAYSDTFDDVTVASQMTLDFRLRQQWGTNGQDWIFLDHGHNDRYTRHGTTVQDVRTITSLTASGAQMVVGLSDTTGIAVEGALYIRQTGIVGADWAGGRVAAVTANSVTVDYDISGMSGTFSSGTAIICDLPTVEGAYDFIIAAGNNEAVKRSHSLPGVLLAGPPSEYTGGVHDPGIRDVRNRLWAYAKARGYAFFDVAHAMGATLEQQHVFFKDRIHPQTTPQRKLLGDIWATFMLGDVTPVITERDVPMRARGVPLRDGVELVYSDLRGGVLTPVTAAGALTDRIRDGFDSGLSNYTLVNNGAASAPVIFDDSGNNRLRCATNGSGGFSILRKFGITLGKRLSFGAKMRWPATSGVASGNTPRTIELMWVKNSVDLGGGTLQQRGFFLVYAVLRDTGAVLVARPFTALNVLGPDVQSGFEIEASVFHDVRFEIESSASGLEAVSALYLDDELVSRLTFDNTAQFTGGQAPNQFDVGCNNVNGGAALTVEFDDIFIASGDLIDVTTPYTGDYPPPGGTTLRSVNGKLYETQ